MEMGTHHQSKCGSMEDEDRLSSLPDDILHSILRELPLKHAVRTSVLSRRWAPQWLRALASSRVLDFTDRDFARARAPAPAVAAIVRRCLELHAEHGTPLDVFRVALRSPPAGPSFGAFQRDVVGWIASAVARGAMKVEVNVIPAQEDADDDSTAVVELPGDLFAARNSLAHLALGGFSLRAVPAASIGLAGLRSLSLSHVDLAAGGAVLDVVVSSCRALEHLSLSNSGSWRSSASIIRIASETLRVLEIVRCVAVKQVWVTAPALESIAFHDNEYLWHDHYCHPDYDGDDIFDFDGDMPALRDVYLSKVRYFPDSDTTNYDSLLESVDHAPVWTISCDGYRLPLLFDTTNIQELQLLIASEDAYREPDEFSYFFLENELPLLDRLFGSFPGSVTDAREAEAAAALASEVVDDWELEIRNELVLNSLSFIKLVNFRGTRFQLQLLAFVLKRAPTLEHLVLVTAGEEGGAPGPGDEHLEAIQRHVSAMQKASPHARLTVYRPSQDRSQNPVHTRIYDDDDEKEEEEGEEEEEEAVVVVEEEGGGGGGCWGEPSPKPRPAPSRTAHGLGSQSGPCPTSF